MNIRYKLHFLFTIVFTFLLISCGQKKSTLTFQAMDTFISLQAYGKNSENALNQAKNRVLEIENLISTTNKASEIYKLNKNQEQSDFEQSYTLSPEVFQLLRYSCGIAKNTSGALNPCLYPVTKAWGFTTGTYTVPEETEIKKLLSYTDFQKITFNSENSTATLPPKMQLDFGAVGKGYAGDHIIEILRKNGVKSAILDLGGNVQTLGSKTDGGEWSIGIKNPWDGTVALGISVSNKAVITSGGYERYFTADDGKNYIHIFDGTTGHPVENDIVSVTIITEKGIYGDALSTALFVMGSEKAVEYWKNHGKETDEEFQFIIMTKDNKLIMSQGVDRISRILTTFVDTLIIN